MTLVLVRHAWAGERVEWDDDDRLRPLDELGHRQARALVDLLAPYAAERIVSSPYVRCLETVVPLATVRVLPLEPAGELAEDRQELDGLALLRSLAATDAIVCTHGGDPWRSLVGGRYRKAEAAVLDDGLRVLELVPPP